MAVSHAVAGPTTLGNGAPTPGWNFIGGAERRDGPFGIGGDFGVIFTPAVHRATGPVILDAPTTATPLLAVFGAYHFGQAGRGAEPFVQGGIMVPLIPEGGAAWELAGGADWWLTPRVGIRTAVRDRIDGSVPGWLGVEGGIVLR